MFAVRWLLALALLVSIGPVGVAHADRQSALRYFRSGEKAYRAQSFAAAAESFRQAFLELPLPEIAFSAAQAYRRQFRIDARREYVEHAVEMYRFYLDKVKSGGRVADAADSLGEMERELDKLGSRRQDSASKEVTQLGVTVDLSGTTIATTLTEVADASSPVERLPITATLDGTPVEADRLVDVTPGDHVFRVEAPGFVAAVKKGHAIAGRSDFVEIELQPLPARLVVETERGAKVSIDGRGEGTAPLAPISVPAGRHVVTIVRAGREPVARDVELERGGTFTLTERLVPTTQRRVARWMGAGGTAIAVITGATVIGAFVADHTASSKLDRLRLGSQDAALLADYRSAHDRRDSLVTASWVTGGAALVVGAVACVLYFADTPSATGIRVAPYVAGSTGGASIIGRF